VAVISVQDIASSVSLFRKSVPVSPSVKGLLKFVNLDDLRATFWAPRANNRMDASTANALHVEGGSCRIGFTFVTLPGRFIFDHHDGVHGEVTMRDEFSLTLLALEGRGASCAYEYGGALGSRCLNYRRPFGEMQGQQSTRGFSRAFRRTLPEEYCPRRC
jgi:hypothetical protein